VHRTAPEGGTARPAAWCPRGQPRSESSQCPVPGASRTASGMPRMPAMALLPDRVRRSLAATLAGLALLAAGTATAEPARYVLDPVHTRVPVAVSHACFFRAMGTVSCSGGSLALDHGDWISARLDVRGP